MTSALVNAVALSETTTSGSPSATNDRLSSSMVIVFQHFECYLPFPHIIINNLCKVPATMAKQRV